MNIRNHLVIVNHVCYFNSLYSNSISNCWDLGIKSPNDNGIYVLAGTYVEQRLHRRFVEQKILDWILPFHTEYGFALAEVLGKKLKQIKFYVDPPERFFVYEDKIVSALYQNDTEFSDIVYSTDHLPYRLLGETTLNPILRDADDDRTMSGAIFKV